MTCERLLDVAVAAPEARRLGGWDFIPTWNGKTPVRTRTYKRKTPARGVSLQAYRASGKRSTRRSPRTKHDSAALAALFRYSTFPSAVPAGWAGPGSRRGASTNGLDL